MIEPLAGAHDAAVYGGKAVQLGEAVRAGLPVPPGYAISIDALARLISGDADLADRIGDLAAEIGGPVAVRSSAVGEDAVDASFAGQHVTVLNLTARDAILNALRQVRDSAHGEGALAYRQRRSIAGPVQVAAVIQRLVDARCAGVVFTRHPVTGADEFVVEAAWGLGESVVQGIVTPDHFRLARDGSVLEEHLGSKSIAIRCAGNAGTQEMEVDAETAAKSCLSKEDLQRLAELALRCEAVFGEGLDLEWAFADGALYLLQSRPITTRF